MRLIVCVFDTVTNPNLKRADFLEASWLDSIHQLNMPEMCSAFDTKLFLSGTITLHLMICESRTLVTFGVVDKLALPVLLGMTFIDRYIRSVYPAEKRTVSYHYPSVPIVIVH